MAKIIHLIQTADGVNHASKQVAERHLQSTIAYSFNNTFNKLDGMKYTDKLIYIENNLSLFRGVITLYEELKSLDKFDL